ncbi:ABC transporter ATP-binding protein [Tateyamaria pelophila]|uniref:ABC transporter ATP-binding protein n=1 Tax=Tateyamaria pelophila TaxID=328415 RepID=UPI001CBD0038|nr:ABC transporter ATP-binding protein [Tateyamaria pelophila]
MTARFLLQLVRPYRAGLALLMTLLLAESVVSLLLPLLAGRIGDAFLSATPQDYSTGFILAAILGLLALTAVLRTLSALLSARSTQSILNHLRQRIFDHLLALPVPWHQQQERGSLMALATFEIDRLGYFVTGTLVSLLPLLLTAGGATVLLFTIDPVLAFLVPLLVPFFFVMLRVLGRLLRGLAQRIQAEHAATTTRVEEMLELLPALKAFTAEPAERKIHAEGINRLKTLSLHQARIYAVVDPVVQFAVAASAAVLLVLVGQRLQAGQMSPGETISFLMYAALLVRPVSQLASVYGQVQTARGTLARLQAVLNEPTEPPATGAPFLKVLGDIRFEDVSFAYPERGPTLHGLSFHVHPGETIALTGVNGSGKSTAIGLLLGFLKPADGRILLDGQDIETLPLDHLRRAIGYVPQTRQLRNASVRDNIVFGHSNADQAQIEAAARTSQAHEFITKLPEGYYTLIGDRGLRLSGGQQQRIALARALLRKPPILVLDEATSMYDLEGEAAFISECRRALAGHTVILITHRPASLALADKVVRIAGGRIVEELTQFRASDMRPYR